MKASRRRWVSAFGLLSVAVGLLMTMLPASATSFAQCSQTQPVAYNYPLLLLKQGIYQVNNVPLGPECSAGDMRCYAPACSLHATATASAKTGPSGATLVIQRRPFAQFKNTLYPSGNWTTYATASCTAASAVPKSTCTTELYKLVPGEDLQDPEGIFDLGVGGYQYLGVCGWKAKIGQISRTTKMVCNVTLEPYYGE